VEGAQENLLDIFCSSRSYTKMIKIFLVSFDDRLLFHYCTMVFAIFSSRDGSSCSAPVPARVPTVLSQTSGIAKCSISAGRKELGFRLDDLVRPFCHHQCTTTIGCRRELLPPRQL